MPNLAAVVAVFIVLTAPVLSSQVSWERVFVDSADLLADIDCLQGDDCLVVGAIGGGVGVKLLHFKGFESSPEVIYQDSLFFAAVPWTVYYRSRDTMFFVHDTGRVYSSFDGGKSWTRTGKVTARNRNVATPLSFLSSDTSLFATRSTRDGDSLYLTYDAWNTWHREYIEKPYGDSLRLLKGASYLSDGTTLLFWARIGQGTIIVSRREPDAPEWEHSEMPVDDVAFRNVSIPSDSVMYCGLYRRHSTRDSDVIIVKSEDAGRSWQVSFDGKMPDSLLLTDFEFADEKNGLAISTFSLLRTTDGGRNWVPDFYRGYDDYSYGTTYLTYDPGNNGIILAGLGFAGKIYVAGTPMSVSRSQHGTTRLDLHTWHIDASRHWRGVVEASASEGYVLSVVDPLGRQIAYEEGRFVPGSNEIAVELPSDMPRSVFVSIRTESSGSVVVPVILYD